MTQSNSNPLCDFRNFLWLAWRHLSLPNPTPIQYDIAYWLQNGPRRAILEAFRGVGKSWITSVFVAWLLLMDPQVKILVVSASKERADNFTTFTQRLIRDMPVLQHLTPGPNQRNSKVSFDVRGARGDHAPSVKSVGITGMLSGSRADIIIADDVEIPNNSLTQTLRDRLAEAVKEFDAIIKPGGRIIFLGTPQTEMSLYNVLPKRGYKVKIYPARYPQPEHAHPEMANLLAEAMVSTPEIAGHPTDPDRFSDLDLLEREASYGRSGFALQFMLDTSLSDRDMFPLKTADMVVMGLNSDVAPEKVVWASSPDLIPKELPNVGLNGDKWYRPMQTRGDWIDYESKIMAIDPSGRGADELAWYVLGYLNGQIFVIDGGGTVEGYADNVLKLLAKKAHEFQVDRVVYENNFGDGMFGKILQPVLNRVYPVTLEEVRHSTQKEKRIIDTLEPVLNSHRLVVNDKLVQKDYDSTKHMPEESAHQYMLFYQLTHITPERGALRHDDRADCLAMGVNHFVEIMNRDVDEAMEDRKNDLWEAEFEEFLADAGASPRRPKQAQWMRL